MRKYMTIKNALLTLVVASIYYKSIFADVSVFMRVLGTVVIGVALMGMLQEVDKLYMEEKYKWTDTKKN